MQKTVQLSQLHYKQKMLLSAYCTVSNSDEPDSSSSIVYQF